MNQYIKSIIEGFLEYNKSIAKGNKYKKSISK